MATSVALDTSPSTILRSLRGQIVDARIAYPEVLHVEVCDAAGELWRFATQDAEFAPSDPASLVGQVLERVELDPITAELRGQLADGSQFLVTPAPEEAADDPPNWELITPDHLTLEFGPGLRWHVDRADEARHSAKAGTRDRMTKRLAELDQERKRLERALAELGVDPTDRV